eukprot:9578624-Ditylum_brightwellii.AAC.1
MQYESTSSSSSGRHYRHYKAALIDNTICMVHATMMALPFQYGFTPANWLRAIDVMLGKGP